MLVSEMQLVESGTHATVWHSRACLEGFRCPPSTVDVCPAPQSANCQQAPRALGTIHPANGGGQVRTERATIGSFLSQSPDYRQLHIYRG